jgi:hypothetical protein
MTKLIGGLCIILICIGGLGYFLGWFTFSKDSTPNETRIGVTVHEDKVKQDEEKAQKALKSAEEKVKGEIKSLRNK